MIDWAIGKRGAINMPQVLDSALIMPYTANMS